MKSLSLTKNQLIAFEMLYDHYPAFLTPTYVGEEVGKVIGKAGKHSSFGSPILMALV